LFRRLDGKYNVEVSTTIQLLHCDFWPVKERKGDRNSGEKGN
jgi:hypothetical protein